MLNCKCVGRPWCTYTFTLKTMQLNVCKQGGWCVGSCSIFWIWSSYMHVYVTWIALFYSVVSSQIILILMWATWLSCNVRIFQCTPCFACRNFVIQTNQTIRPSDIQLTFRFKIGNRVDSSIAWKYRYLDNIIITVVKFCNTILRLPRKIE